MIFGENKELADGGRRGETVMDEGRRGVLEMKKLGTAVCFFSFGRVSAHLRTV